MVQLSQVETVHGGGRCKLAGKEWRGHLAERKMLLNKRWDSIWVEL
jgi:hypothetical protein